MQLDVAPTQRYRCRRCSYDAARGVPTKGRRPRQRNGKRVDVDAGFGDVAHVDGIDVARLSIDYSGSLNLPVQSDESSRTVRNIPTGSMYVYTGPMVMVL